MDKRYYYTDPLKVAWMKQEFSCDFDCITFNKFYIHPDSLHLFKPLVGDVVVEPEKTIAATYAPKAYHWQSFNDWESRQPATIIQRDGKAFFWPEVDNG